MYLIRSQPWSFEFSSIARHSRQVSSITAQVRPMNLVDRKCGFMYDVCMGGVSLCVYVYACACIYVCVRVCAYVQRDNPPINGGY